MSWWAWLLFWVMFSACSLAYLVWRTWKLWPHLCDFWQTLTTAWDRAEQARHAARVVADAGDATAPNREVGTLVNTHSIDSLAWNKPPAHWKAERAAARRRRRELRLDEHAETWARWKRRVD